MNSFFRDVAAMISLPQLHMNSFVLPRASNLINVRRLVLAAGRASGLALELSRILATEPKMVRCVALDTGRRTSNLQRAPYLVQSETKALVSVFFLHQRLSIKQS